MRPIAAPVARPSVVPVQVLTAAAPAKTVAWVLEPEVARAREALRSGAARRVPVAPSGQPAWVKAAAARGHVYAAWQKGALRLWVREVYEPNRSGRLEVRSDAGATLARVDSEGSPFDGFSGVRFERSPAEQRFHERLAQQLNGAFDPKRPHAPTAATVRSALTAAQVPAAVQKAAARESGPAAAFYPLTVEGRPLYAVTSAAHRGVAVFDERGALVGAASQGFARTWDVWTPAPMIAAEDWKGPRLTEWQDWEAAVAVQFTEPNYAAYGGSALENPTGLGLGDFSRMGEALAEGLTKQLAGSLPALSKAEVPATLAHVAAKPGTTLHRVVEHGVPFFLARSEFEGADGQKHPRVRVFDARGKQVGASEADPAGRAGVTIRPLELDWAQQALLPEFFPKDFKAPAGFKPPPHITFPS